MRRILLVLPAVVCACRPADDRVPALTLRLDSEATGAGQPVGYELVATGADGTEQTLSSPITSDLEPAVAAAGGELTATVAGLHALQGAATVDGTELVATATLKVTAGTAMTVDLVLGAERAAPEEPVAWSVTTNDAWGNPTGAESVTLASDGEFTIGTTTLSGTQAGEWTVTATLGSASDVAPLGVDAGQPAAIELQLTPGDASVTAAVRVADAWDNALAAPYSLSASGGATTQVGDTFLFLEEAAYYITATADGTGLSATEGPVIFDESAPDLVVTDPVRGTWAAVEDGLVAGTISDGVGVAELTVNGEDAFVDGAAWSFDTAWTFGLNVLESLATDGAGNTAKDVRGLLAGDILPAGSALDDGIVVRFNEGEGGVDAVASAAGEPVDRATVLAALPSPLIDDTGRTCVFTVCVDYELVLTVTAVDWASSTVTLDPQADGTIAASLTLNDLEADWTSTGTFSSSGTATATDVTVRMFLAVAVVDGELQVEVVEVSSAVSGLDMGLPSSYSTMLSVLGVDPETELELALEAAADAEFADELAQAVEDQLAGLQIVKDWALGESIARMTALPASVVVEDTGVTIGFETTLRVDTIVPE